MIDSEASEAKEEKKCKGVKKNMIKKENLSQRFQRLCLVENLR